MGKKIIEIYQCDCCKKESNSDNFSDGSQCGSSTLIIKGSRGSQAYDGAWGGCSHEYKGLLCFECANKLIEFYNDMKKNDGGGVLR